MYNLKPSHSYHCLRYSLVMQKILCVASSVIVGQIVRDVVTLMSSSFYEQGILRTWTMSSQKTLFFFGLLVFSRTWPARRADGFAPMGNYRYISFPKTATKAPDLSFLPGASRIKLSASASYHLSYIATAPLPCDKASCLKVSFDLRAMAI